MIEALLVLSAGLFSLDGLADDDFAVRQAASARLDTVLALRVLNEGCSSRDPEVRNRCQIGSEKVRARWGWLLGAYGVRAGRKLCDEKGNDAGYGW